MNNFYCVCDDGIDYFLIRIEAPAVKLSNIGKKGALFFLRERLGVDTNNLSDIKRAMYENEEFVLLDGEKFLQENIKTIQLTEKELHLFRKK